MSISPRLLTRTCLYCQGRCSKTDRPPAALAHNLHTTNDAAEYVSAFSTASIADTAVNGSLRQWRLATPINTAKANPCIPRTGGKRLHGAHLSLDPSRLHSRIISISNEMQLLLPQVQKMDWREKCQIQRRGVAIMCSVLCGEIVPGGGL